MFYVDTQWSVYTLRDGIYLFSNWTLLAFAGADLSTGPATDPVTKPTSGFHHPSSSIHISSPSPTPAPPSLPQYSLVHNHPTYFVIPTGQLPKAVGMATACTRESPIHGDSINQAAMVTR